MQRTMRLVAASAAAMALLAIGGASSASAGFFSVSAGTTGFSATSTEQYFTETGGIVGTCNSGGSFTGAVSHLNQELGGSPSNLSCNSSAEKAVSWNWNGCKVSLHPGNNSSGSTLDGTFSIGPAGCGPIQVNSATCEKRISAQSGAATFLNSGGSVAVTATKSLPYSVVKSGGSCWAGNLNYTGKWNVTPSSGTLEALTSKVGISIAGGMFGAAGPPWAYPIDVSGGQVPAEPHAITLVGNRVLKCASVDLSGQLTSASSALALAPQFTDCVIEVSNVKLPATVNVGSCGYGVNTAGSLDITCQNEGDGIVITSYQNATKQAEGKSMCVYRVGPQSGLTSVTNSNVGAGVEAGVKVQLGIAKLPYTRTSGNAVNCGEASANASYSGSSILNGILG